MVLDNSFRLRHSPFVIHEQFPAKIVERRHALYPVMNEARRQGKRTSMIRDKLYINGESYKPPIQNSTKNPDSRNYREALLTPQRGGRVSIHRIVLLSATGLDHHRYRSKTGQARGVGEKHKQC